MLVLLALVAFVRSISVSYCSYICLCYYYHLL